MANHSLLRSVASSPTRRRPISLTMASKLGTPCCSHTTSSKILSWSSSSACVHPLPYRQGPLTCRFDSRFQPPRQLAGCYGRQVHFELTCRQQDGHGAQVRSLPPYPPSGPADAPIRLPFTDWRAMSSKTRERRMWQRRSRPIPPCRPSSTLPHTLSLLSRPADASTRL